MPGELLITQPRMVSAFNYKDFHINYVTASDAATAVATTKGDIYVLYRYQCRKSGNKVRMFCALFDSRFAKILVAQLCVTVVDYRCWNYQVKWYFLFSRATASQQSATNLICLVYEYQ